jgi:hypothetical protein
VGKRASIFALCAAAGLAVCVPWASAANQHQLNTLTSGRGVGLSSLQIDGQTFYSVRGAIANARLHSFANSSIMLVTWDESGTSGDRGMMALSTKGTLQFDQIRPVGRTLRLKYAEHDPVATEPAMPDALRADAGNELYVVQMRATPLEEMRREIASLGGTVERFLPDTAHVVRMSPDVAARVAALSYVRGVTAFHPAYRMDARTRAAALAGDNAARHYSIETFRRGMSQQQAVADRVRALGGTVNTFTPDQYRMEATLTPAQLLAIARSNEVHFIDVWDGPGEVDMQLVRQLEGAIPTLSDTSITGQGVRGEVIDSELRTTHQAFQVTPPLLHGGSSGASVLHGTACFGILFTKWPSSSFYNGMVSDAEQPIYLDYLLTTQMGSPGLYSRLQLNTEAVDPNGPYRSCFQSSSVGNPQTMSYTTISAEVDDYLQQVDYLSFQSQSNTGSMMSRPQAWAKNIISVGGLTWNSTLSRSDDTWATGSSYGPAADGRQKPDLINCFDSVPTTWGASDSATVAFNGTSAATPITAGAGALAQQMWHLGVFPGFGGGASVFDDRPYSLTVKALLVNTAYRYSIFQGGLSRDKQGWGIPDLTALTNAASAIFIVNGDQPVQNAQTRSYRINVTSGAPWLRATMAYTDPMGNTAATPARVNDVRLRVTAPDSTVYWGNNGLDISNASASDDMPSVVDTLQNVFVPAPQGGVWIVDVIGNQVVQDAYAATPEVDARFALVVTGGVKAADLPCYANCDGSTTSPVLTAADFTCFLSKFRTGDSYANCDGSTSVPVLTAADFTCFLSSFRAGCP